MQASETLIAAPTAVEDDRAPATLGDRHGPIRHHGWYVAPVVGVTQLDGDAAATFGVRAAWRVNRRFGLGLAATGLELDRDEGRRVDLGYGGLLVEYILHSNELLHAVVDTTVGGGAWCHGRDGQDDCDDESGFFVAEPTLNLELNVTSFMRFSAGGGYRLALASEHDGLGSSELSGFVARTALEFGRF